MLGHAQAAQQPLVVEVTADRAQQHVDLFGHAKRYAVQAAGFGRPGVQVEAQTRLGLGVDAQLLERADDGGQEAERGEGRVELRRSESRVDVAAPGVVDRQLALAQVDAEHLAELLGARAEQGVRLGGQGAEVEVALLVPEADQVVDVEASGGQIEQLALPAVQHLVAEALERFAPAVLQLVAGRDLLERAPALGGQAPAHLGVGQGDQGRGLEARRLLGQGDGACFEQRGGGEADQVAVGARVFGVHAAQVGDIVEGAEIGEVLVVERGQAGGRPVAGEHLELAPGALAEQALSLALERLDREAEHGRSLRAAGPRRRASGGGPGRGH